MSETNNDGMEEKGKVCGSEPEWEPEPEERPSTSLDSVGCFHGFITAKEAEYRLHECDTDGALILRADQNLAKQEFCLSWLSSKIGSVMHFP